MHVWKVKRGLDATSCPDDLRLVRYALVIRLYTYTPSEIESNHSAVPLMFSGASTNHEASQEP
jgi:hypothetical protein